MRYLLEHLGNPERTLPIIHIAGTNGKGSTSAMLASIFQAAGYRVGLYTSPHLQDYRERIRINGRMIPEADLADLLREVRPLAESAERGGLSHPTEFEVGTVCMYLYFRKQQVDLVIQETGLGGLWDSTNTIDRPLLSVITSIGLDHQQVLGSSLEEIAGQKAGIIKPGSVVLSAEQPEDARRVLEAAAREKRARLEFVPPAKRQALDRSGQWLETGTFEHLHLQVLGRHQLQNAALAVRAAVLTAAQGFPAVDETAIRAGLDSFRWPGRLERIQGKPEIWLDGAHNPSAAKVLFESIVELELHPVLLFSMLTDKDVPHTLRPLLNRCSGIVFTQVNDSRALSAEQLLERCRRQLPEDLRFACRSDLQEALDLARGWAGEQGEVLVTGSLYLVGAVRDLLHLPPA